jgi:hypothetical protein
MSSRIAWRDNARPPLQGAELCATAHPGVRGWRRWFGADPAANAAGNLRQVFQQNSINPLAERDLGVVAVADIATKHARTPLPSNLVADAPNRRDPGRRYCRTPRIALARFSRRTCW